jgi:hypothetical protein
MASKKMVTERSRVQIQQALGKLADEKGPLRLAILSSTDLPDRWSLLVSAPWMDSAGSRSVISDLTSRLLRHVDKAFLPAIDHISVIPGSDPFVRAFVNTVRGLLGVDPSAHRGGFSVHAMNIEGRDIAQGFVFAADAQMDNISGRKLAAK